MPSGQNTNRRALVLLFLTIFVAMVGFGVIMPILPFYAENMGANATTLGLLFATYSIIQFFFSPIWGQVSDRIGRKPPLLIGLLGFSVSFALFGLATHLWMLFAARILGGLLSAAVLPTVMAYIADTTDDEHRGSGMGVMGASMGMGVTFGPVIGGFLGHYSPALPFFFSAGLAATVAVVMFFLLPESLPPEARKPADAQARRGTALRGLLVALSGPLAFILVIAFLSSFATANLEATFALFTEVGLGFGAADLGILFGVMGITMAFTQGFLVGPMIGRWGEARMIQLGLVASAVGYVALLFTFDMATVLLVMVVMGVGSAAMRPAITSLVSKRTTADKQGNMMGVVNSYNSLGRIFGPTTGGLLFDHLGYRSPYIFGAAIFFVTYLLSIVLFRRDDASRRDIAAQRSGAHTVAAPAVMRVERLSSLPEQE
jgi:DHA1 family multidrug resistance protein-like MFS transporter